MKHFIVLPVLAIAAAIFVFTAAPALGAESQSEIVKAFRLLDQVGLVVALPADDLVLSKLDPFEMAAMLEAAAQRLGFSGFNRSVSSVSMETPVEAVARYLGETGAAIPAPRIVAAFALLEQSLMREMRLLKQGPYFVTITPDMAYDSVPSGRETAPDDLEVFIAPGKLRDYRLISGSPAAGAGLELRILF